jgi:hypothetical protein
VTRAAALVLMMVLGGCATLPGTCPAGQHGAWEAQLVFGRNIEGRPGVSDAEFQAFVDSELTPRFPDGLTVVDAAGQWRGGAGRVEREASKLVMLILPDRSTATLARLDAARAAYKARFHQESVMVVAQPVCAGF